MTKREPFHRSILKQIKRITSPEEMKFTANLIKETEIRAGHEKIVEAWRERMAALSIEFDFGVPAAVLALKADLETMDFLGYAEALVEEVSAMTDEDVEEYIKEHNLEYLVTPERIDAMLDEVRGNPKKAARLVLIWDRDKARDENQSNSSNSPKDPLKDSSNRDLPDLAQRIAAKVLAMSPEEKDAYIKEHGLEHLTDPERLEAILRSAVEDSDDEDPTEH